MLATLRSGEGSAIVQYRSYRKGAWSVTVAPPKFCSKIIVAIRGTPWYSVVMKNPFAKAAEELEDYRMILRSLDPTCNCITCLIARALVTASMRRQDVEGR